MPVPGRALKPDGQKRNRVKPTYEWTDVLNVPYTGKVPVAVSKDWPAATKRWWRIVSRMPHCVLWTESDWQFAHDTGFLVAVFHGGQMNVAPEIRQREKLMGTTMDARREIRVRYVHAVAEETDETSVSALADYRDLIGA